MAGDKKAYEKGRDRLAIDMLVSGLDMGSVRRGKFVLIDADRKVLF
jgi:hypothetical protein